MPLKLDGKKFEINPMCEPLRKIFEVLDVSPHDELYSSEELNRKIGCGPTYVQHHVTNDPRFAAYSFRIKMRRYFGHPKAILALRKQIENESK